MKTTKLFEIKLRGFSGRKFYVVDVESTNAYNRLRKYLDKEDYGNSYEREFERITVIATDYILDSTDAINYKSFLLMDNKEN